MHNLIIPTTIVDGFFNDPDAVRELALKQEFSSDPENKWPGKRSKPLHEIDPELFKYVNNKFLNLFYPDVMGSTPYLYTAMSNFQLIDSSYKAGWVHVDTALITIIIYLNRNPNKEAGTIIYSPKNEGTGGIHGEQKRNLFRGAIDEDEGGKYRQENNDRFKEEIIVKNKFNRLFAFDANLQHGVQDFSNDEPRLTLVSFIYNLQSNNYPIHSMHRTQK
jgi:hypothetical protein